MLLEREEAGSLCKLLRFLFLKEELTFEEMKRMLDCVEVEDERKEAAGDGKGSYAGFIAERL